jgi:aspartate-semialdehyde dehydrogenase
MSRINVGIIGATFMVGQNYIRLLAGHPVKEAIVTTLQGVSGAAGGGILNAELLKAKGYL